MDSHNATGNASNHVTADKRKRKASTLTDDVNDGGVGPSLCCSCVHCNCGCHNLGEATTDSIYLDSLPIGYRFDPTDEELITHYLLKKIKNEDLPKNKIGNAYIYGNHPKDIVGNYPQAIEGVWYFFTSRNRKYVNGKRPSRKAGFGYWKATGPDHAIMANGTKICGRKSLVYHEGHPPKGTKTDWMMQEYVVVGYQRQRLNLQDMKLDDHVLCKIYTNTKSRKEINEQLVSDQQPRVVSNDQAMVPYQQATQVSNQETNPSIIQVGNNVGVQHFQNSNRAIHHVENGFPALNSDQHMNPTVVEVKKRVREVKGHVMVHDQQARVVSNQDVNPTIFHVENNVDVQHSNYDENNSPIMDSNQHMMNSSVENGVKEVKGPVIVNDQQTCPTVFQVENNVVVQNYQHVGSFYDLMTPYPSSLLPFQRTSFPRIRAPLGHDYSLTRFNHNYSLPNPTYFPLTPTKSAPPPPRIVNAPHVQVHPGMMYWSGPSFNPPPSPQAAPPTFQEGNDCNGIEFLNNNIEFTITQDGNVLLDDNYHFSFDGHEDSDVD